MRRFGQFFVSIFLFAIVANYAHAQTPPWSGIIDPNRAIDWSAGQAGVPGGIPSGSWTQCGSTVPAGTSAATINSLLAACPQNTYLLLGPGTFNLNNTIEFPGISYRAVRGSGANSTFLVFSGQTNCQGGYSDVCMASGDNNYNMSVSNSANWTAGYAKGATTITLSRVTNLKVGFSIILDQIDESAALGDVANKNIFVCGINSGVCTTNGDTGDGHRPGPSSASWRGQQQNVTVTQCDGVATVGHACSSGANITISPGLYMPNWCPEGGSCPTTQPGAWWPTNPVFEDGLENLSIDNSFETNQFAVGVFIYNCVGCWVSGIRSVEAGRAHVGLNFGAHTQIQNNYFWRTYSQSSVSYGLDVNNSSDSLFVNNIFEGVTFSIPFNGNCSGCVAAYNFSVNQWYTTGAPSYSMLAAIGLHSEGDDTILIEGNQVNEIEGDDTHGTHNMVTLFRNYADGYEQNGGALPVNALNAYLTRSYNRFFNVIGNLFGNSYTKSYIYTGVNGIPIVQSQGGGAGVTDDIFTQTSAMLWANWDPISGTRYCGPGAPGYLSSPCLGISEVPTAITHWPNATPASTTLPASFLYRSQPSWWPSNKPWPLQGPDVTGGNLGSCNGGTYAAASVNRSNICAGGTFFPITHGNSSPAMDCFLTVMGGSPIGTDPAALPFNASTCYTQSVSNNPPPQPPTNLSATVN